MMHKDRISSIFLKYGELNVKHSSLIFTNSEGKSCLVPVNQFSTICLEPGTTITHDAIALCSSCGCMINWVGENGVRIYSSGSFSSLRSDRLWCQAEKALNKNKRLSVARKMYMYRFSIGSLGSYTIEQLSGMEAGRVKYLYKNLARDNDIEWTGRKFIVGNFDKSDLVNRCISTANSCIYGIAHTAILSAGYSPAMGFIHGKTAHSFVYDVADLFKFKTVTRIAFNVAADTTIVDPTREVRYRCRDFFHRSNFMDNIIPIMDYILEFGGDSERDAVLHPQDFQSYADNNNIENTNEF